MADIQQATGLTSQGISAATLLDVARQFGLIGRAVRVELTQLHLLDPGAILHWEFRHFVVFELAGRACIDLVDPAFGRRRITHEQFSKSFTGVALLFTPAQTFRATEPIARERSHLRVLVEQRPAVSHALSMSLLLQLFALALPALMAATVDRVIPNRDQSLLTVLAASMAAMTLFHFVATWVRAHLLLQLRTALDVRMTLTFLDHLVHLPFPFFQVRSAGDLINRLASNGTVREILTSNVLSAVLDGTLVLMYLILLLAGSWQLDCWRLRWLPCTLPFS